MIIHEEVMFAILANNSPYDISSHHSLPKNLHHMTQEDLDRFARQIRSFFTDPATFSISRRTQEDCVSAVIYALKDDPGVERAKVWSWKYSSHISHLDNDPSDEEAADETSSHDRPVLR